MNRLRIRDARAVVFKAGCLGRGWVAYCPCMTPPIRKLRWRDAYDALKHHIEEIHL